MSRFAALRVLRDRLILAWTVTGVLTILIPLIGWGAQRLVYFAQYGVENYMHEAEENYEQAQQYYNEQNNNYWKYYFTGYYNMNEQNFYQKCWSVDWFCRKRQYYYATYGPYGNRQMDQQQQQTPLWYIFLGGRTESMDEWEEHYGHEVHANAFVYSGLIWAYLLTIGLFFGLLAFGVSVLKKEGFVNELRAVVGATAIIALMNMIMSVGLISTDQDDLEDYYFGWFGQIGVLMVYTNFCIMIFAIVFAIFFLKSFGDETIKDRRARRQEERARRQEEAGNFHSSGSGDYQNASHSSTVEIN